MSQYVTGKPAWLLFALSFSSVSQRRLIPMVVTGRVLRSLQKLLMSSDQDRIPGRKPQHTYESKRKPIFSFLSENDQVFQCYVYDLIFLYIILLLLAVFHRTPCWFSVIIIIAQIYWMFSNTVLHIFQRLSHLHFSEQANKILAINSATFIINNYSFLTKGKARISVIFQRS